MEPYILILFVSDRETYREEMLAPTDDDAIAMA